MDDPTLTPSDPLSAPKPLALRRKSPLRPKAAPKPSGVAEVTCAPRHLQPWGVLLAAVIVLAVVVFAVVSYAGKPARAWSAVFLTNGQVYFGHVARDTRDALDLRDVYYLQVTPPLQQRAEGQPAPKPDITLVKLGNEIHGPTDAMTINREHVLFTEDLRDNSTIVQAIATAKERAAAPAPAPSGSEGQPTAPAPTEPPPAPAPEAPAPANP